MNTDYVSLAWEFGWMDRVGDCISHIGGGFEMNKWGEPFVAECHVFTFDGRRYVAAYEAAYCNADEATKKLQAYAQAKALKMAIQLVEYADVE